MTTATAIRFEPVTEFTCPRCDRDQPERFAVTVESIQFCPDCAAIARTVLEAFEFAGRALRPA